jgi:hypothetical protein
MELQRTEPLSLSKLMHLPISTNGAFLINYLSSLISVSLILFLPAMLGITLGVALGQSPLFLLLLPLLAAFLFMVTALTYQFQGWLASLMANKRRRQIQGQLDGAIEASRRRHAPDDGDEAGRAARSIAHLPGAPARRFVDEAHQMA